MVTKCPKSVAWETCTKLGDRRKGAELGGRTPGGGPRAALWDGTFLQWRWRKEWDGKPVSPSAPGRGLLHQQQKALEQLSHLSPLSHSLDHPDSLCHSVMPGFVVPKGCLCAFVLHQTETRITAAEATRQRGDTHSAAWLSWESGG